VISGIGVRRVVKLHTVAGDAKATQLKLAVSPNTKQIKIISQPAKQPIQIIQRAVPAGIVFYNVIE